MLIFHQTYVIVWDFHTQCFDNLQTPSKRIGVFLSKIVAKLEVSGFPTQDKAIKTIVPISSFEFQKSTYCIFAKETISVQETSKSSYYYYFLITSFFRITERSFSVNIKITEFLNCFLGWLWRYFSKHRLRQMFHHNLHDGSFGGICQLCPRNRSSHRRSTEVSKKYLFWDNAVPFFSSCK